jgi:hypothetical protein
VIAVFVLLVLAAIAAAGARVFQPHSGHHTDRWLTTHGVDALRPHHTDIGKWV